MPAIIIGDIHLKLLPHIFHQQFSCPPSYWVWINGLTFLAGLDHDSHVNFCHSRINFLCKVLCPFDTAMPTLLMHEFNTLISALRHGCSTGVVTWPDLLHVEQPLFCGNWVNRSARLHSDATNFTSTDRAYALTIF